MSNERQFKSAKLQVTLAGAKHPKGATHILNNVKQNLTAAQVASVTAALESLTGEQCTGANIVTTEQFAIAQ